MSDIKDEIIILDDNESNNNGITIDYLKWYDYLVFVCVLLISASVGIYFAIKSRKNNSADEYLLASKQLSVLPVSLSLFASFISAISLLGIPADIYVHGMQYAWVAISYTLVMLISNEIFLPVFAKLKVRTSYQYLGLRFCKASQIAGCVSFSFQMILYMGIVIYAPSLALSQVTGFPLWIAVISIGAAATFYTAIGGIKAVVWTDVFQVTIMLIGVCATLVKAVIDVGGVSRVWEIAGQGDRLEFFNTSLDPTILYTVWSQLIGQTFVWASVYAINQTMVQRALSLGTLREMKLSYWLNAIYLFVIVLLCSACGLVAYANYANCDPLLNGRIRAYDQLMPLLVMDKMANIPLMPGIFVASIFCGALSTVSSGVNSLASITINDILDKCVVNFSETRKTYLCKGLACCFGFISLGFAVIASLLGSVLQAALGVFGMVGGPLLGVFTLGMFFRFANSKGALIGHAVSQLVIFWIGFGYYIAGVKTPGKILTTDACPNATTVGPITRSSFDFLTSVAPVDDAVVDQDDILPIYKVSYAWYALYGWAVAILVGVFVSALTRDKAHEQTISKHHFTPIVHRFLSPVPADSLDDDSKKGQSIDTEVHLALSGGRNIDVYHE